MRDGLLAPKDLVSEANKIKNFNEILDYIARNTTSTKCSRREMKWEDWHQRFNLSREDLLKHSSSVRPSEFQVPPGIVNLVNAIKTTGKSAFSGAQDEPDHCVRCDFTKVASAGSSEAPKTVCSRGFRGSVFAIPELGLARRHYRLVVLDPPFGWNVGGAHWDKTVSPTLVLFLSIFLTKGRPGARTITCPSSIKSCSSMSLTSGLGSSLLIPGVWRS